MVVVDERDQRRLVGPGRRRRRARAWTPARSGSPRRPGRRSPVARVAQPIGVGGDRRRRSLRRTASPAARDHRRGVRRRRLEHDLGVRQVRRHPATALRLGMRVRRHLADVSRPSSPCLAKQRELDVDVHLAGDHQRIATRQLVQGHRHRHPRPSSRSARRHRRPRRRGPRRAQRSPTLHAAAARPWPRPAAMRSAASVKVPSGPR